MIADGGGMFARVSRAFFFTPLMSPGPSLPQIVRFFFVLVCSGTLKLDGMKKSPGDTFETRKHTSHDVLCRMVPQLQFSAFATIGTTAHDVDDDDDNDDCRGSCIFILGNTAIKMISN